MRASVCPRCGAALLTLAQLAEIAIRADAALERMRLVVPGEVSAGLRVLASALACHAGLCRAKEPAR